MPNRLRNITVVASATIGSRILGLMRDVLLFALLGASALNSAFLIAFTLPNLFRRLLGEGALSSALVPVLSEELEQNGRSEAFQLLNRVVTRVALVLLGVVVVGSALLALVPFIPNLPDRWYLAADLAIVLLPYVIFVCVAAMLAAGLNVMRRFAAAALSQVWLNLSILFALGVLGAQLAGSDRELVGFLCAGVLFGGLLQLVVPGTDLGRIGWRPRFRLDRSDRLAEIWRLFLPGVWGAAILQVNFTISRLIALSVNDSAVSILYLANRLIELPLGVFSIAITTVVFPELAREAAHGRLGRFAVSYYEGGRLILAITLPAAFGLYLLREPIVSLLFEWGAFGVGDVARSLPVLSVYAVGLPFYGLAAIGTRAFHALKDMRTPVRLSGLNFVVNIGASLLLVKPYGIVGLAIANVFAVVVHIVCLQVLLQRKLPDVGMKGALVPVVKICIAALLMALVTGGAWSLVELLDLPAKARSMVAVFLIIPLSILIYFGVLVAFRLREARDVRELASRLLTVRGKDRQ